MDPLYRKTFDQISMDRERAGEIRTRLTRRCAEQMEELNMKQNARSRRPLAALIAVGVVAALTVTAFAYGKQISQVFHMMTGDVTLSGQIIQEGEAEDGSFYTTTESTVDAGNTVPPVEKRDGRLYFVMNGEDIDITDKISRETPYLYDCTGPDDLRHVFLIGGSPEAPGWMELSLETALDGSCQLAGCTTGYEEDGESLTDAPWFRTGLERMGQQLELNWVLSITDGGVFFAADGN